MADTKISAETSAGALDGSEIVPVVKAGANRRTTTQTIANLFVPPGITLDGLSDVSVPAPSNGNVLTYQSGSPAGWIASAPAAGGSGGGLFSGLIPSVPTDASIGFTNWYSQGSATLTDGATGPYITLPPGSGQKTTGRYKAAPGTPYSIRALVALNSGPGDGGNNPGMGIGWTNGTATQVISLIQVNAAAPAMFVASRATDTSAQAAQFTDTAYFKPLLIWMKISDDGTNVSFGWGVDGVNFRTVYTVAKASGALGASGYTNVGVFVLGAANNDGLNKSATVFAWLTGP